MDRFSPACQDFGLTISMRKTNVTAQDVDDFPTININDYVLELVHELTYLGSTIAANLSLEAELNKRIGRSESAGRKAKAQTQRTPFTNAAAATGTAIPMWAFSATADGAVLP